MEVIDIKFKNPYPANVLSNYYPNAFEIDGVKCAGMEGFLQGLKYKNPVKQIEVCALCGQEAKDAGKKKRLWKLTGNVYWQGKKIRRNSSVFNALIMRAYALMAQNADFTEAVKATDGKAVTHSVGRNGKRRTILTAAEFIYNIEILRKEILRH